MSVDLGDFLAKVFKCFEDGTIVVTCRSGGNGAEATTAINERRCALEARRILRRQEIPVGAGEGSESSGADV